MFWALRSSAVASQFRGESTSKCRYSRPRRFTLSRNNWRLNRLENEALSFEHSEGERRRKLTAGVFSEATVIGCIQKRERDFRAELRARGDYLKRVEWMSELDKKGFRRQWACAGVRGSERSLEHKRSYREENVSRRADDHSLEKTSD